MAALGQLGWQNFVDFAVLAATLYALMAWAQEARALRIVLTIASLHAASLTAQHFELIITAWVLRGAAIMLLLLLVMLFQPEVRRALMRLDSRLQLRGDRASVLESAYDAVSVAVFSMAASRTGALIVFGQAQSVKELIEGGVQIGAEVTREIIEAIFQKQSPIHDGAILIEDDRVDSANLVLPLTHLANVPKAFGTRHRAAMGLAERSDAVIIVVSEERGEVRLLRGREVRAIAGPEELSHTLTRWLERRPKRLLANARNAVTSRVRLKLAAVAVASIVWGLSLLSSAVVRVALVPVEFANVPPGMTIADVSTETLRVELRGRPWLLNVADLSQLVFYCDLSGAHAGRRVIPPRPEALQLPPGVHVDAISPSVITVEIEPAHAAAENRGRR